MAGRNTRAFALLAYHLSWAAGHALAAAAGCVDSALGPPAVTPSRPPMPESGFGLSINGQIAYEALKAETVFASAAVGPAGVPSRQARHLRTLSAEPGATTALASLWREAEPAGRLYALAGQYLSDPEAYRANVHVLIGDTTPILTLYGCFGMKTTVGAIAQEIAKGELPTSFRIGGSTPRVDSLSERWDPIYPAAP